MIKCEVICWFTLNDYKKLKNIQRKTIDKDGELYPGDTFECDEKMAKYLTGENKENKVVVKILQVEPKVDKKKKNGIIKEEKGDD